MEDWLDADVMYAPQRVSTVAEVRVEADVKEEFDVQFQAVPKWVSLQPQELDTIGWNILRLLIFGIDKEIHLQFCCGKSFSTRAGCRKHYVAAHTTRYRCAACSKTWASR